MTCHTSSRVLLAGALLAGILLGPTPLHGRDLERPDRTTELFDRDALARRAIALVAQREGLDERDLRIVNTADAWYRWLQRQTISYKIIDANDEALYGIEMDLAGRAVDPEQLDADDAAAYRQQFGKLDRKLAELLPHLEPGETVTVSIWVHEQEFQGLEKPTRDDDLGQDQIRGIAAEQQDIRRIFVAATLQPLEAFLTMLDVPYHANEFSAMITADLTADQIDLVHGFPPVEHIDLGLTAAPDMDVALPTIAADQVHSSGYTGSGVKVAQVETNGGRVGTGASCLSGVTQNTTYSCWTDTHARRVALIIQSPCSMHLGVAYNCNLWAGGSCSGTKSELEAQSNRAVSWGATALNLSWGVCNSGSFTSYDKFYDEIAYYDWLTIVKSAGNQSGCSNSYVNSPGSAYNVLTVGNFNDQNTTGISDDTIASGSCYKNPDSKYGDRLKPEVAAPGVRIRVSADGVTNLSNASGTSFSAPQVTGVSALLMERDPYLEVWHEGVRAILMATAWNNVNGSSSNMDNRDGAGGIRAKRAYNVVAGTRGGWDHRSYSCSTSSSLDVDTMSLTANKDVRVVIVWDQNPTYSRYKKKPSADLDLKVISPSGSTVASSYSYDNTYEFVHFTPSSTGTYKIRVKQYRCSKTPSYIAWAWHQTQ